MDVLHDPKSFTRVLSKCLPSDLRQLDASLAYAMSHDTRANSTVTTCRTRHQILGTREGTNSKAACLTHNALRYPTLNTKSSYAWIVTQCKTTSTAGNYLWFFLLLHLSTRWKKQWRMYCRQSMWISHSICNFDSICRPLNLGLTVASEIHVAKKYDNIDIIIREESNRSTLRIDQLATTT